MDELNARERAGSRHCIGFREVRPDAHGRAAIAMAGAYVHTGGRAACAHAQAPSEARQESNIR